MACGLRVSGVLVHDMLTRSDMHAAEVVEVMLIVSATCIRSVHYSTACHHGDVCPVTTPSVLVDKQRCSTHMIYAQVLRQHCTCYISLGFKQLESNLPSCCSTPVHKC